MSSAYACVAAAAGHGRMAVVATESLVRLCSLLHASCDDVPIPRAFGALYRMVGLTSTRLWGERGERGERMFRFKF